MRAPAARILLEDADLSNTEWGQRIIRAEADGGFTDEEKSLAACWTTCACSNLDKKLMGTRGPTTADINARGRDFQIAVYEDSYLKAASLLMHIQKRVTHYDTSAYS